MNFFIQIFHTILYRPLLNLLILLYTYIPGSDFGIAVILLTLLIKIVLFPSSKKSIESQRAMAELQPKIKELQKKYKDDKPTQTKELMALYKTEKVSPMSGCLPILLQLPILIALYQVFLRGLELENLKSALYSFVPFPGAIQPTFLRIIDLFRPFTSKIDGQTVYYWPVLILALLAAAVQFFQTKMIASFQPKKQKTKGSDFGASIQKQMLYFLPVLSVIIIIKFGSIIGLYWLASSVFSVGEQYLIKRKSKDKDKNKDKSRELKTTPSA